MQTENSARFRMQTENSAWFRIQTETTVRSIRSKHYNRSEHYNRLTLIDFKDHRLKILFYKSFLLLCLYINFTFIFQNLNKILMSFKFKIQKIFGCAYNPAQCFLGNMIRSYKSKKLRFLSISSFY